MPIIALGASSVQEFGNVDKTLKLVQATMGSTSSEAATLESAMKTAAANSVFGMQDAGRCNVELRASGLPGSGGGEYADAGIRPGSRYSYRLIRGY